MNLLLHGLETPQIAYGNTLERRGGRDRQELQPGREKPECQAGTGAHRPSGIGDTDAAI
ncbi:MAG: hypothetical protein LBE22_12195 [Azoarcus sp.]|jgi:hypothetical protein|nr:hypothetical protein [Azoarcus sp.]